eukprot:TRINITY_DN4751_c0_g1_i1.p1 TRINITY_DN4751_c0_g1~~TRINITY_DN4751_c0_g1_i1.p1  ORF type:complete len:356 (+),score=128.24 TRINITY_DN4751_c0_g1_i1:45-1112(+)
MNYRNQTPYSNSSSVNPNAFSSPYTSNFNRTLSRESDSFFAPEGFQPSPPSSPNNMRGSTYLPSHLFPTSPPNSSIQNANNPLSLSFSEDYSRSPYVENSNYSGRRYGKGFDDSVSYETPNRGWENNRSLTMSQDRNRRQKEEESQAPPVHSIYEDQDHIVQMDTEDMNLSSPRSRNDGGMTYAAPPSALFTAATVYSPRVSNSAVTPNLSSRVFSSSSLRDERWISICVVGDLSSEVLTRIVRRFERFGKIEDYENADNILHIKYAYAESAHAAMLDYAKPIDERSSILVFPCTAKKFARAVGVEDNKPSQAFSPRPATQTTAKPEQKLSAGNNNQQQDNRSFWSKCSEYIFTI